MKEFKIIFLLTVTFSFMKCSNSKTVEINVVESIEISTESKNLEEKTCRFTVSLYSIGEGTDGKARTSLENFVKSYSSKNKIQIAYKTVNWGREGEVDYCFSLSELNVKQQETFIAELKELLKESKLVHFKENEACKVGR